MAPFIECKSSFFRGEGHILGNPSHSVQLLASNRSWTRGSSLGTSEDLATLPFSGAESQISRSELGRLLAFPTRLGNLSAGPLPDVRARLVVKASPDLSTLDENRDSNCTSPPGGGGAAQSRAHLTCVHTRVRLTHSAPHTCAPPLGPGPATRVGIWEPRTVSEVPSPNPSIFPAGVIRSLSRFPTGPHPSLPPSAAEPVSAATSPEPVRRQRGEGEEARDELREGVGGPEPDEDAPGAGTRTGAGAGDRTKPPLQPTKPRRRPGPRSPPRASCRNHSLTWSRPNMGCTCSSCLCWSSSSWAL